MANSGPKAPHPQLPFLMPAIDFKARLGCHGLGFAKGGRCAMVLNKLEIPTEQIADFCRRNGIRRLALFGSILRDDFTPESDVDVLVEFEPGTRTGFRFFTMEEELSNLLGRRVDLNTPNSLSKHFREEVLEEAQDIYGTA